MLGLSISSIWSELSISECSISPATLGKLDDVSMALV
jgi:hypothetical protein